MNKKELNPGLEYARMLQNNKEAMFNHLKKDLEGCISGILSDFSTDEIRRRDDLYEEEEECEPLIPIRYGFEEGEDGYSLERIGRVSVRPDGRIEFCLVGYDGRYYVCNGVWELLCVYDWVVWWSGTNIMP